MYIGIATGLLVIVLIPDIVCTWFAFCSVVIDFSQSLPASIPSHFTLVLIIICLRAACAEKLSKFTLGMF